MISFVKFSLGKKINRSKFIPQEVSRKDWKITLRVFRIISFTFLSELISKKMDYIAPTLQ